MKILRLLSFLLPLFFVTPGTAWSLAGEWQSDDALSARLISAVNGVGQQETIPLGLEIKLAPDWHTYWRSPGEAGLPPAFDWKKSQSAAGNFKSASLFYPAPKHYTAFGLQTIGYRDYVVLPIDVDVQTPGKPLDLDVSADILICSQLCVPKHLNLKLIVPEGPANESAEAAILKKYRDLVPADVTKSGLSVTKITSEGQNLIIDIASTTPMEAPDVFVENEKYIEFGQPTVVLAPDKLRAELTTKATSPIPDGTTLADIPYTLTVVDGDRSLEQKVSVQPAAPAAVTPTLPLGFVILFAIIGGFILNLMPCVLPVLSLKILSVASHGGGTSSLVRHSFLHTAAGVIFSFLVLALVTILFKTAGLAVGWGVQFQQPVFLGLLVLLLTFFAANMWGFYEIRLPRWLADNFSGPYHPKLAGDFATGAFATLLATPCTAPFLGTAVGFALASGPRDILIIFLALGFGMSLPYLAVACMPRLATALPRPGMWMVHLRHLLGWALAITALWLIWVLAAQITERGAFVVGLCMLAILGLFRLRHISSKSYLTLGIACFTILAFGTTLAGSLAPKTEERVIDSAWRKFDEGEIARSVQEGKIVFVDVTADWCLTCKANKKIAFSSDEVTHRLFHTDIIAMQADWTNPDKTIAAFLEKYGRFGIPFNAVFGPGAPQGIVLPELLTPQRVLDALDKAAKPAAP